jgi:hypothetical protein
MPIHKICPVCGKSFRVRPRDIKQIYCSKKCRGIDMRGEKNPLFGKHPNLGRHPSPETCKKISESKIGEKNPAWKPKVIKECPICHNTFELIPSRAKNQTCCSYSCALRLKGSPTKETREKIGLSVKKNWEDPIKRETYIGSMQNRPPLSEEECIKRSIRNSGSNNPFYGKHHTEEVCNYLSENRIGKYAGENCPNWKGGITPLHLQLRTCQKYYEWRTSIFERDGYRDWFSGIMGHGNLNAHHIEPFSILLERHNIQTFEEAMNCEALWDINNGVTMLESNHTAYHLMWDGYNRGKHL